MNAKERAMLSYLRFVETQIAAFEAIKTFWSQTNKLQVDVASALTAEDIEVEERNHWLSMLDMLQKVQANNLYDRVPTT